MKPSYTSKKLSLINLQHLPPPQEKTPQNCALNKMHVTLCTRSNSQEMTWYKKPVTINFRGKSIVRSNRSWQKKKCVAFYTLSRANKRDIKSILAHLQTNLQVILAASKFQHNYTKYTIQRERTNKEGRENI